MTGKRCVDCKYTKGIGYDFWCGEGHTEYEVFGGETDCPYFEYHDWSKGVPSRTAKRFHWDWKTGRMKDTYSDFQATKDMRLIEQSINDACRSYEKQIAKLEKENEELKHQLQQQELEYATTCNRLAEENEELQEQRAELFIRERDTKNDWRELKQENESLKEEIKFL